MAYRFVVWLLMQNYSFACVEKIEAYNVNTYIGIVEQQYMTPKTIISALGFRGLQNHV